MRFGKARNTSHEVATACRAFQTTMTYTHVLNRGAGASRALPTLCDSAADPSRLRRRSSQGCSSGLLLMRPHKRPSGLLTDTLLPWPVLDVVAKSATYNH